MAQFDQRYQQVETQYNADQITIQQQPLSLTEKQRKQNRIRMLERIKAIWIDGVLEPSIQGAAQITLTLQNKPSAVVTPLQHVLQEFDKTGPLLSADASIIQVYDQASGEVLILGEPGTGKTTLLLELTYALLERARQDESYPIPVVFPLSSWATRRQPLSEWLATELHDRYQIPLPLAASWIKTDQVLPLLDGLDEVATPYRVACIEAINTYRQAHGLLPTVVCSRQTDYLALSPRLLLRTAVVVQPLTLKQIESYLTSGGERLEALRETLHKDADLRALASTPLMLNVFTAAYQGTTGQEIDATGSLSMKQEQIFATFVRRMLTRRDANPHYTSKQTIHWLSSLARQMKQQSQTIFYIERMQPDWLASTEMGHAYLGIAVLLPNVLIGVLVSLIVTTIMSVLPGQAPNYLVTALIGGWLGGLLSTEHLSPHIITRKRCVAAVLIGILVWLSSGFITGMIYGGYSLILPFVLEKSRTSRWITSIRNADLRIGLFIGLPISLVLGLINTLNHGFAAGLAIGLIVGIRFGASGGLLSALLKGTNRVTLPTDRLIWSWTSLGKSLWSPRHLKRTLSVVMLMILLFGVSFGLGFGLGYGQGGIFFGLVVGLATALTFGTSYWLLFGLEQGVSSETIEDTQRITPNQGIHRSAFNGIILGIISTLCVGLSAGIGSTFVIGLLSTLQDGRNAGLSTILIFGLLIAWSSGVNIGLKAGLVVGLRKGGLACWRHYVLRTLLWRSHRLPWRYARFLNEATERTLLRKVGGGYIFLHGLLLDYFANLEATTGFDASAESSQQRLQPVAMPSASVEPIGAGEHSDVPTVPLAPTPVLSEVPRLLPCGHEWRPHARFCGVCGAPVPS